MAVLSCSLITAVNTVDGFLKDKNGMLSLSDFVPCKRGFRQIGISERPEEDERVAITRARMKLASALGDAVTLTKHPFIRD